jgi:hypothetical protein
MTVSHNEILDKAEAKKLLEKVETGTITKAETLDMLTKFNRMGLYESRLCENGEVRWFITEKAVSLLYGLDGVEAALSEYEDAITQLEAVRIAPHHEHAPQGFSAEEMEATVAEARRLVIREILSLVRSAGAPAVGAS